jgi:hypothetical protein
MIETQVSLLANLKSNIMKLVVTKEMKEFH